MKLTKTDINDLIESLQAVQRTLSELDLILKSHSSVTYDTDDDRNFICYTLTIRYPDGVSTDGLNEFKYDFLDASELYKFASALVIGAKMHCGQEI